MYEKHLCKNNCMPIPLDAINAANGTLTQNQGY